MKMFRVLLGGLLIVSLSGCTSPVKQKRVEILSYDSTDRQIQDIIFAKLRSHNIRSSYVMSMGQTVLAVDENDAENVRKILSGLGGNTNSFSFIPLAVQKH